MDLSYKIKKIYNLTRGENYSIVMLTDNGTVKIKEGRRYDDFRHFNEDKYKTLHLKEKIVDIIENQIHSRSFLFLITESRKALILNYSQEGSQQAMTNISNIYLGKILF